MKIGVVPCSEHTEPGIFFGSGGGFVRAGKLLSTLIKILPFCLGLFLKICLFLFFSRFLQSWQQREYQFANQT